MDKLLKDEFRAQMQNDGTKILQFERAKLRFHLSLRYKNWCNIINLEATVFTYFIQV